MPLCVYPSGEWRRPIAYTLEVMYTVCRTMLQTDSSDTQPTAALSVFKALFGAFVEETFQLRPTFFKRGTKRKEGGKKNGLIVLNKNGVDLRKFISRVTGKPPSNT